VFVFLLPPHMFSQCFLMYLCGPCYCHIPVCLNLLRCVWDGFLNKHNSKQARKALSTKYAEAQPNGVYGIDGVLRSWNAEISAKAPEERRTCGVKQCWILMTRPNGTAQVLSCSQIDVKLRTLGRVRQHMSNLCISTRVLFIFSEPANSLRHNKSFSVCLVW